MMSSQAVEEKYLAEYAEPGHPIHGHWESVVVIPSRREDLLLSACIRSLTRAAQGIKALAIIVINGDIHEETENQKTWDDITILGMPRDISADLRLVERSNLDILLINRFCDEHRFKIKDGVGLARKTGCDFALRLIQQGSISSRWIRSTDADVLVPENYFCDQNFTAEHHLSARIFAFHHTSRADSLQIDAMNHYERFLNYYVAGLKYAGSPYAFHSVGSTLCIHKSAYAHVRGFPNRLAGEDFYLLNKIRKIGTIIEDDTIDLAIEGRVSDRTPFGTGQSIMSILDKLESGQEYLVFDPKIFLRLRFFLQELALASRSENPESSFSRTHLGEDLYVACCNLDLLPELLQLHKSSRDPERRLNAFHTHFDGLKTLRLLNLLSESFYPKIPLHTAESLLKTLK